MSVRHRWIPLALLASTTAALSCGDRAGGPTAPDRPIPALEAGFGDSPAGLLRCRPLDYDSVTQMVTPAGDVLRVSKHVLSIPAMALSRPVRITLVVPSDSVNRIQMQPEGLVFDAPVTLTMSYVNCDTGLSTDPKQIAYTDDSLTVLEYEPSVDDFHGKKVAGELTHFSQYAVSW
jgi:hypothetical protein